MPKVASLLQTPFAVLLGGRFLPLAVLFVFLAGLPARTERSDPSSAQAAFAPQASKAPCWAEPEDDTTPTGSLLPSSP